MIILRIFKSASIVLVLMAAVLTVLAISTYRKNKEALSIQTKIGELANDFNDAQVILAQQDIALVSLGEEGFNHEKFSQNQEKVVLLLERIGQLVPKENKDEIDAIIEHSKSLNADTDAITIFTQQTSLRLAYEANMISALLGVEAKKHISGYKKPVSLGGRLGEMSLIFVLIFDLISLCFFFSAWLASSIAAKYARLSAQFRASEEMQQKLLSFAAHEIKNPVTTIKVSAVLLREMIKEEEGVIAINMADRAASSLITLADNLLSLGRVKEGRLVFHKEVVHVQVMIDNVVTELEEYYFDAKARACRSIRDVVVYADLYMVSLVLRNIISNALRHSPEESIVVIDARQENCRARITVTNEGKIPQEIINEIFLPFGSRKASESTGLGFYIACLIIREHGGKIEIKNLPNNKVEVVMLI